MNYFFEGTFGTRAAWIRGNLVTAILMLSFLFGSRPEARPAQPQSLVEGNTAFALKLFAQLKAGPGNLFFSPYSISTALAMTYAGARGQTEKQIGGVLHFDQGPPQLHAAFGELQRQLNEVGKSDDVQLSVANALWAQAGHPFLPGFEEIAKGQYEANVNQADFKTRAEPVRQEINRWVAEKTKEKIQNILPPGSINGLTRLVLANAIYFKGAWAKPYNKSQTQTQPFHLSKTRQAETPLMHHLDDVRYLENSDFQAVELPYRGNRLSMLVLLPRQVDGCAELESRLTPAVLSDSITEMKPQKVDIYLPRFKLESSLDLNDALTRLGMPDAFRPNADFSGMDGTRLLHISKIFHKAWGEVNEEGTEAAAATTGVIALASARRPSPPPVFRADHPFVFFIRDSGSGSLLFLGRFADPAS